METETPPTETAPVKNKGGRPRGTDKVKAHILIPAPLLHWAKHESREGFAKMTRRLLREEYQRQTK